MMDGVVNDRQIVSIRGVGRTYMRGVYLLVGLKLFSSVLLGDSEDGWDSAYAIFPKIVDVLILIFACVAMVIAPSTKRKWRVLGAASGLLVIVCFSQAFAERAFLDGFFGLAKFIAPILLLSSAVLNNRAGAMTDAGARALVWWVVGLSLLGLFAVEPSFRNGKEWLPAYFGGAHTSSYVASLAIVVTLCVKRKHWLREPLMLAAVFLLYMVVFGWGVRTAMSAGLLATGYMLLANASPRTKFVVGSAGVLGAASALLLAATSGLFSSDVLEAFSSGRTSVWLERLHTIFGRGIGELLVGTGAGTNVTVSSVWWWADKDSHNDYIAMLYDHGILGLLMVVGLLVAAYLVAPRSLAWNALWLIYVTCSALSNGLMFRPTAACVFAIAAIVVSARHRVVVK